MSVLLQMKSSTLFLLPTILHFIPMAPLYLFHLLRHLIFLVDQRLKCVDLKGESPVLVPIEVLHSFLICKSFRTLSFLDDL